MKTILFVVILGGPPAAVLGIGLMTLAFYSNRHGHDDGQFRGSGSSS